MRLRIYDEDYGDFRVATTTREPKASDSSTDFALEVDDETGQRWLAYQEHADELHHELVAQYQDFKEAHPPRRLVAGFTPGLASVSSDDVLA